MQIKLLWFLQLVRKTKLLIVKTTQEYEHTTPNRRKVKNHDNMYKLPGEITNQDPTHQFTFIRMVKL